MTSRSRRAGSVLNRYSPRRASTAPAPGSPAAMLGLVPTLGGEPAVGTARGVADGVALDPRRQAGAESRVVARQVDGQDIAPRVVPLDADAAHPRAGEELRRVAS